MNTSLKAYRIIYTVFERSKEERTIVLARNKSEVISNLIKKNENFSSAYKENNYKILLMYPVSMDVVTMTELSITEFFSLMNEQNIKTENESR